MKKPRLPPVLSCGGRGREPHKVITISPGEKASTSTAQFTTLPRVVGPITSSATSLVSLNQSKKTLTPM